MAYSEIVACFLHMFYHKESFLLATGTFLCLFDVLRTLISKFNVSAWLLSLPLFMCIALLFSNNWVVISSVK